MQDQRSTGRPPYNPQLWRGKNCDRVYRRARRESARRVYLQTTNSGSGGGVVTQARDGSAAAGARGAHEAPRGFRGHGAPDDHSLRELKSVGHVSRPA